MSISFTLRLIVATVKVETSLSKLMLSFRAEALSMRVDANLPTTENEKLQIISVKFA